MQLVKKQLKGKWKRKKLIRKNKIKQYEINKTDIVRKGNEEHRELKQCEWIGNRKNMVEDNNLGRYFD